MRIKQFFSELSWHCTDDGFVYPVFCQNELNNIPLKWLKHLFLVRVGLRDISELNKEIHRFAMSPQGLLKARETCLDLFHEEDPGPGAVMIVLKIVFANITMGLPNYRVSTVEQIPPAFTNIEKIYLERADELWLCRSNISQSATNLGGRISLRLDSAFEPEVIELVWYTSPRVLDNYQVMNYPYPYLRALRLPGFLSFALDSLNIPKKFVNQANLEQKMLRDYNCVMRELYRRKEHIGILTGILCRSKVKEVVLEFKMDSGQFKMIDWDTDIETKMASHSIW